MTDAVLDLDATAQLTELQAGRISAVELLSLSMVRRDETHQRLNAVIVTDPDGALKAAKASDAARARGEPQGPLAGLPMTAKDTLDVVGMPASSGLPAFLNRDCRDATVIAKARAAGAVIWGKTNVPVMAGDWQSFNDLYGTSNNPWDVTCTPGGSSGGAAVALATGITALEIGSDIGGSLRVPANYCGVYSHKPSWGAVSPFGHIPPAPGTRSARDLNVVGPMARSARDLSLLFQVIADRPDPPVTAPAKIRVGLWLDEPSFPLDPQVRTVIDTYAKSLITMGVRVDTIACPVDAQHLSTVYRRLLSAALFSDLSPASQAQMQAARASILEAIAAGSNDPSLANILDYTVTHAEWIAADEARAQMTYQVATAFAEFDVILAPVTATPAFPHDHTPFNTRELTLSTGQKIPYASNLNWIALATACRLPATCVPAGLTAHGLPVGVQLIGPPGGDALTLAVAEVFEAARGFVRPAG